MFLFYVFMYLDRVCKVCDLWIAEIRAYEHTRTKALTYVHFTELFCLRVEEPGTKTRNRELELELQLAIEELKIIKNFVHLYLKLISEWSVAKISIVMMHQSR